MGIFKDDYDTKRIIFNINLDIADRLEKAKKDAKELGKKLDIDDTVNKSVEKFLKRVEKKLAEMQLNEKKRRKKNSDSILAKDNAEDEAEEDDYAAAADDDDDDEDDNSDMEKNQV